MHIAAQVLLSGCFYAIVSILLVTSGYGLSSYQLAVGCISVVIELPDIEASHQNALLLNPEPFIMHIF